MGIPAFDSSNCHAKHDQSQCHIPPIWSLPVRLAELHMNVILLIPRLFELPPYLSSVEQINVHNDRGDGSERKPVTQSKCSAKEQRRVGFVFGDVKFELGVEDATYVVLSSSIVVTSRSRERQIFAIPSIGKVKDRSNEPDPKTEANKNVGNGPERSHERRQQKTGDLRPIECKRDNIQS